MQHRDVFNKFCISHGLGPREDIENYPDVPAAPAYAQTSKLAVELIASARDNLPKLLLIHFDFVSNPKINAWAFRVDDEYFIGLTSGAMEMLRLVLDHILANPFTFPDIGDAAKEQENRSSVAWNILDAEKLFNSGVRTNRPFDARRRIYAVHLADQAILFLIGHEIAHITRGHVDYLKASSKSPFISELGWSGSAEKRLERQVLEVDADRRSTYARCYSAHHTWELNKLAVPAWADSPVSPYAYQFDWSFAVNTLFRLFGDKRFAGADLDEQAYPPLPLRQNLAIDAACRILFSNSADKNWKQIEETFMNSVLATEFSFGKIGADPADGGLDDALTAEGQEHIRRLRDRWEIVRDNLSPYSYEQLDDG